jgi:hypothetical protein
MQGNASAILCPTLVQFQGIDCQKTDSRLEAAREAVWPVRRREMTDRRLDSLLRVIERAIDVAFLMLRA